MLINNHLKRMAWVFPLVVMLCFDTSSMTILQENENPTAISFPRADNIRKAQDDYARPLYAPKQPILCNDFREYADDAILKWHPMKETYLIVISRLGVGEKGSNLGRSRLKNIEVYFDQRYNGEVRYVTAEGSRVKSFGRVEFYLGGKLLAVIPIKKNAMSVCSGKVNPFL